VKKGYISNTHANFGSILKTIYNIAGVPYVNQYDVTATLLQDFFTDKPDFTPYTFRNARCTRIFDVNKAMKKYKTTIDWNKIIKGPEMDKLEDMRADHYRQQKQAIIIKVISYEKNWNCILTVLVFIREYFNCMLKMIVLVLLQDVMVTATRNKSG
jgi:hypothetical protein